MGQEDLQATQAASGTITSWESRRESFGEILIDDTEEALDKLIETLPSLVLPGEFSTDQAVERYHQEGCTATKAMIVKWLAKLVDDGKLNRRKFYIEGKRRTLFSWVKDEV